MFTGLIEALGTVEAASAVPSGMRLVVAASLSGVTPGESVAINGVCLTVVSSDNGRYAFDIGPETVQVTALGRLAPGERVNVERAMHADARLGGHFVQGHVDTTLPVLAIAPDAGFTWISYAIRPEHRAYLIPKGAVAIDGISLTVATLDDESFRVQIVPFTWEHTNLSQRRPGDAVNVEFDMLGKYAVRAAQLALARSGHPADLRP